MVYNLATHIKRRMWTQGVQQHSAVELIWV